MKAEIITIGDEIVSGHTLDSNAAFIAQKLSEIGIVVSTITSVGDRLEDIQAAIVASWRRSEVTVATGGLGPTSDDLTKQAICLSFDRKLVLHEEILEDLEARFAQRKVKMPGMVQSQALLPQGATLLPNRLGSAVGIVFREENRFFVALPGVPIEMQTIVSEELIPELRKLFGRDHIEVRRIRTTGVMESEIAEMISDLEPKDDHLRLAYLPDYRGVDLRITGRYATAAEAKHQVEQLTQNIAARIGKHVFTVGDQSLAEVVAELLTDRKKSVVTAESCTGGLTAKYLTDVPGSSSYFLGSVVAYSNDVKIGMLGVPRDLIDSCGAVSAEVAGAMAEWARERFHADIALSTTGIAGPSGGTEEKPVGLVYIGYSDATTTQSWKRNFTGTRERVRERTAIVALDLLRRKLLENS